MSLQFLGPASSRGQHAGPVPDWAAGFSLSGAHLQRPQVPLPHWALDGSLRQPRQQAATHPHRQQAPMQELVTNPWADEFARMNSARLQSGAAAHPHAGWAYDFAVEQSRLQPGTAEPLWPVQAVHSAQVHSARLQLVTARPPQADGHPQAPWVSEFLQPGAPLGAQPAQQGPQQPLPGAAWAEEFQVAEGAQWAHDFQIEQLQALTPEQLKQRRGPQADDPLEDLGAPSWVRQFNEEMVHPSANAGAGECPHAANRSRALRLQRRELTATAGRRRPSACQAMMQQACSTDSLFNRHAPQVPAHSLEVSDVGSTAWHAFFVLRKAAASPIAQAVPRH